MLLAIIFYSLHQQVRYEVLVYVSMKSPRPVETLGDKTTTAAVLVMTTTLTLEIIVRHAFAIYGNGKWQDGRWKMNNGKLHVNFVQHTLNSFSTCL